MPDLHFSLLTEQTAATLNLLTKASFIKNFYLAGGTGLALQLGHRLSEDLDFFSQRFSVVEIKNALTKLTKPTVTYENQETLYLVIKSVKVSFFFYQQPLLFPAILYENIKVADERDIAAMKLAAIAGRGSKRDFVDVYFLLKKYSLAQLFSFFTEKFKEIPYSRLHLLKSLTYFKDAEDEPMPQLTATVSWKEIKESLTKQTIKLLKEQLS